MQKKRKSILYRFFFDDLLKSSWRSVLDLWKPMAVWTLLVYLVFTALSAPLLISLLDWSTFRGERLFIGNEDLYKWFFSPAGFSYLFVLILITLTGLVIRFAGLFQIVTNDLLDRKISIRETALHIAQRIPVLLKLCVITMVSFILLLIPLGIGLLVVYHLFLTEFDLNYYGYVRPPIWTRALIFGGIWSGVWFISSLIVIACSLPALPAYLDGNTTLKVALVRTWKAPFQRTLRFLKVIGMAVGGWIIIRILTDATLLALFIYLTDWANQQFESLRPLAFLAGGYIFSTLAFGTIISFFGFSLISVLITKFYYITNQPEILPDAPGFRTLSLKTLHFITWWTKPVRAAGLLFVTVAGSIVTSFLIVGFDGSIDSEDRILTIAHRANADGAPENSLSALENSIRLEVDMVEIDVQLTADSVVVVWHDEDLMRMTGDPRRIADVQYSEIESLFLISSDERTHQTDRMATLEEFLVRSKDRIRLMIELKYYEPKPVLAEKTIDLINRHGMADEIVIKSLNYNGVMQIRKLAPEIPTGYVSAASIGNISRLPVDFLSVYHENITQELVRNVKNRGLSIYAWTINDREGMIKAIEMGVDGIITDYPERTQSIIDEISELSGAERILLQFGLFILEGQSVLIPEER